MQDIFNNDSGNTLSSVNDIFNSNDEIMRRLITLEDSVRLINSTASLNYIQGRLRNNLSTYTDPVASTDLVNDIIYAYPYIYLLMNDSGTLTGVKFTGTAV